MVKQNSFLIVNYLFFIFVTNTLFTEVVKGIGCLIGIFLLFIF